MRLEYPIRSFLCVLFLILYSFSTPVIAGSFYNLPEKRDRRARALLEDAAIWFIEDGLSDYYQGTGIETLENRMRDHNVGLVTDIVIERLGYLVYVDIESWWVRSTIRCYVRINNDSIYEYWVVDRYGGTRGDVDSEIYFLITKAEGKDKKREIIHRTTKFFPEFTTPEGNVIRFPLDNKSIHFLRSWDYPEAFKGTELEGIEIFINDDRQYIRK